MAQHEMRLEPTLSHLGKIAASCVVRRTVNQLFTYVLVIHVSSWYGITVNM